MSDNQNAEKRKVHRNKAQELAFAKLAQWQQSGKTLRLVVAESQEAPETMLVTIAAVDRNSGQVSFVQAHKRPFRVVDFNDAVFRVGEKVLAAERPTGDFLKFEEI